MAGLVLKLGPKERVLINGAVLENDVRRSRFSIITPSANVLRLKDALHPENANTPISRVCYQLQLILAGCPSSSEVVLQIRAQLSELAAIFKDPQCRDLLLCARQAVEEGKFYGALKSLKALLPIEQNLLSRSVG